MKILQTNTAPNPRRVRIFLAEKGIQVPYEELDLMKGALKTPEFTKLNPFQRVPVLILDDGTPIAETVAICRYFEEMQPEPALFGKGALGRATVEMWNRRMELGLLLSVAQAFRHLHPAMATLEVPQVAAWGEANKPRALEVLQFMDKELATRRFIAGDEYSIADITALVGVDFMRPARIQRPEGLKNLARWHEEVSARPSAKA
ncbi:MAG: glutathione S-transferase [Hyphomicrobiaceae bacterium]|nr:MAG: glutathione S-transferase [Hyphomicrobiaceae bacterium]